MISICVPCYNEEEIIESTYSCVKKELDVLNVSYEIIFCNDGSTDNTLQQLKDIKKKDKHVRIVSYFPNKSVGEAYKQLFNTAKGEYIIITDADLSIHPLIFQELIAQLKMNDIVVVQRDMTNYPFYRRIPSKVFNFIIRKTCNLNLSDTQSGTICFRKEIIKCYKFKSKGFELLVELILLFKDYKLKVIKADFIHRRKGRFNILFHGIPMLIRLKKLKC